jgi:hypothetical protein
MSSGAYDDESSDFNEPSQFSLMDFSLAEAPKPTLESLRMEVLSSSETDYIGFID